MDNLLMFLFGLTIIVLLFALTRELMTWYWKINEIVKLLEAIKKNTSNQTTEVKEDFTKHDI